MARRERQSVSVLIAASLLLLSFRVIMANDPLANIVSSALKPLAGVGRALSFSAGNSSSEQQKTQNNNSEQAKIAELLAENSELRDQLMLPKQPRVETLAADVIGKNLQSFRQTIRINLGSSDGIKTGMAVLVDNQMAGVVLELNSDTATVSLIGDPDFRAAAIIDGSSSEGIVRSNAGSLILDMVNRKADELSGKPVLTSGLGGVFRPVFF